VAITLSCLHTRKQGQHLTLAPSALDFVTKGGRLVGHVKPVQWIVAMAPVSF